MGFVSNYNNNKALLSKIATNDGHGENSPYFDGWKAYETDPFHPTTNPDGVIQMGLAENQLCFDLIEDWIRRNPAASVCTAEGVSEFRAVALFQDYHGLSSFRHAIAKFMEKARGGKAKFDPDRVVMSGGATGAHELITFCVADPGDAFLVPSPYYPGFDRDLRWRTGVELIPTPCKSSNDFKITRESLESTFEDAKSSGINVKGLLITNPSNPLGTILDRDTIRDILSFATEKKIHLVCDEIYAATVFDKPEFVSVSEVLDEANTTFDRELVHIIYSLSKDLGVPGFRVGVVYSYNDDVVRCARKMSSFGLVSSQTQCLLSAMLSDEEFTSNFIAESARRLCSRRKAFTSGLARVWISCLEANAGLFCWMDLRHLLREATEDAEMELWRMIISDVKLNVSPGSAFHCAEPGWFRVCFANMDDSTMEVALKRIRTFVFRCRKRRQLKLRLSFSSSHRLEDASMTPGVISPRSPLVRAAT
ncbi:1-aminocyclopropane-1-carboxylate synthase [Acorus gramineus]|uniref:1-aminocyclopropane-1-carboxylate synthase n=1 Tax=Acorus gramineus TaxID=55184 RepID=A0AAV9ADG2_ACOGR|nr:1-aminocyclopropane-1-carboxylate synthase [Acorus gramineus]